MAYQRIIEPNFHNDFEKLESGLSIKERQIIKDSCELIASFGKYASYQKPKEKDGLVVCYFIFPLTLLDVSEIAARYENYVPNFTPSTKPTDWTQQIQDNKPWH